MIHYVTVGVALSRPPKIDEYRRYAVVAANAAEAELIAQQMAAATSTMPVWSQWESSHRAGPVDPYGVLDCTCWRVPWSEDLQRYLEPEVWQEGADCPHHGTDVAAWAALTQWKAGHDAGVPDVNAIDHGIPSDECRAGTCDCGDQTGFEERGLPTFQEMDRERDAGKVCGLRVCVPGCNGGHRMRRPTGAIAPDELKRKVAFDLRDPRTDGMPSISDLGHDHPHIPNADGEPVCTPNRPATLSPGQLVCTDCDDWGTTFGTGGAYADIYLAMRALRVHKIATTETGLAECLSPSPRRTPWWKMVWAILADWWNYGLR